MSKANIFFILVSFLCLNSCYSSLPKEPPCFSDGNDLTISAEKQGAIIVERCCLTADDCRVRFNEAAEDNTLIVTQSIIDRFSICGSLNEETLESFDDLTQEYGTCVLDVHNGNSECRVGADCGIGSRCCPVSGDKCRTKFGEDISSCTICVDGGEECDVL